MASKSLRAVLVTTVGAVVLGSLFAGAVTAVFVAPASATAVTHSVYAWGFDRNYQACAYNGNGGDPINSNGSPRTPVQGLGGDAGMGAEGNGVGYYLMGNGTVRPAAKTMCRSWVTTARRHRRR